MSLIWYVYSNDIVSGPFSTESIETGLQEHKWTEEAMIWWKGQRDWVSLDTWKKNLSTILDSFKTNIQTLAWYVEHLGAQKGPMGIKELYNYIQNHGILGNCRVWTNGMDRWTSIFEINELVNYFGVTRRKHPRAPFKGEMLVTPQSLKTSIAAQPGTISIGGMGIKGLEKVSVGEQLQLEIKSPLIAQPILGQAQVVYTNIGGYTGIEFKEIKSEYIDFINGYVKQFKLS